MTDKEILDKYINLKDSCLNETERNQVMEMLYEYKDVFSLRDEIGTCPNIEVKKLRIIHHSLSNLIMQKRKIGQC